MTYKVLATLIALICFGCGADTDIDTEIPRILDTRVVQIREAPNPRQLDIDFEVIFSSAPVNLTVDCGNSAFLDWEQHSNVVSLYFRTTKFRCASTPAEPIPCSPETLRTIRENPQGVLERTYKCTFVWDTGRQHVSLKAVLPIELAIYTPE